MAALTTTRAAAKSARRVDFMDGSAGDGALGDNARAADDQDDTAVDDTCRCDALEAGGVHDVPRHTSPAATSADLDEWRPGPEQSGQ